MVTRTRKICVDGQANKRMPRTVAGRRKRDRLRRLVFWTTVVPSFAALAAGAMNRHGRWPWPWLLQKLIWYFVINKPWWRQFGSCISSAIAFNGTHGGVVAAYKRLMSRPAASTSAYLVHPASLVLPQHTLDYTPLAIIVENRLWSLS
jgi:hypothetical protein